MGAKEGTVLLFGEPENGRRFDIRACMGNEVFVAESKNLHKNIIANLLSLSFDFAYLLTQIDQVWEENFVKNVGGCMCFLMDDKY